MLMLKFPHVWTSRQDLSNIIKKNIEFKKSTIISGSYSIEYSIQLNCETHTSYIFLRHMIYLVISQRHKIRLAWLNQNLPWQMRTNFIDAIVKWGGRLGHLSSHFIGTPWHPFPPPPPLRSLWIDRPYRTRENFRHGDLFPKSHSRANRKSCVPMTLG